MKNRKSLGLLVALMVSVLCVSNVCAFNAASRVTVGANYYGDVLLGQIYQTNYNFTTKIKVINTAIAPKLISGAGANLGQAIVAKVVFRSAACSGEVLDFFIYLTPSDMWECEIRMNDKGKPEVYSTDDSVLATDKFVWNGTAACNPFQGDWASPTNPLRRELSAAQAGDTNTFGHVEIIGLAAFPATAPLSKDTLAMAYGNLIGVPQVALATLEACDFNLNPGGPIDVPNVLTGTLTLKDTNSEASLNMTALSNWDTAPLLGVSVGLLTGLNNSAGNTVVETEAALAKTEYTIPFDLSATGDLNVITLNTLPTHYRRGR